MRNVAIVYQKTEITYIELEKEIEWRIKYLKEQQPKNGIIGVMLNRGPEYIYWICAILLLKYTFVPIDVEIDEERKKYIKNKAGFDLCILKEHNLLKPEYSDGDAEITVDLNHLLDYEEKPAYIIFTSGSTGLPKGVMISRKSLKFFTEEFLKGKIIEGNLVLANTSFSFDISLLEIVLSLTRKATIYMTSDQEQKNPKALLQIISESKFDWVQFTPSYLNMLIGYAQGVDFLKNVKNIIVGGEGITKTLATLLISQTDCKLFNAYGPTESTIWTHVGDLRDAFINVGKPISCVNELIIKKDDEEYGEVFLGGELVAIGYVNDPELTETRFIKINDEVFYKTGDIGVKRDNKLIILGRNDNQIKILGKRIEIEEIESNITKYVGLIQCIVVFNGTDLIICTDRRDITLADIRKKMSGHYPAEFIPNMIFYMDRIPLTISGKIDRGRVKEMVKEQSEIRTRVLNIIEKYAIDDMDVEKQFHELGINSVDFISIVVKIEKIFDMEFDDAALVLENYKSINEFVKYVESVIEEKDIRYAG